VDQYQQRLVTEGIRVIENDSPADSFNADYSELSFDSALAKRTQLAELRYQVAPVFMHFKQLFKRFSVLVSLIFLMIGATSVSQFLVNDAGTQINFFWAILLFIVPNLLSLLVWLIFYFRKVNLNISWIANLSLSGIRGLDKLHHKLTSKHPYYTKLFQFYFDHRFIAYMGKAQLSFISHLWWSCYLLGATCSLLVVLATHQVDFIWETTILSADVFAQLTNMLTLLPNLLGVSVPHNAEVASAGISIVNSLEVAQANRISWANLLIFSLTVYGLLPRTLLMFIFKQKIKYQQKKFKINYSLPYYIQLKNLLQPIVHHRFISDPDVSSTLDKETPAVIDKLYNQNLTMPVDAYPLAIELNKSTLLAAQQHADQHYSIKLTNILDSESLQYALSELIVSDKPDLVLYVDIRRAPDRGWLSLVNKLYYKDATTLYLVLLGAEPLQNNQKRSERLQDWLEAASKVHISSSRITYLHPNNKSEG